MLFELTRILKDIESGKPQIIEEVMDWKIRGHELKLRLRKEYTKGVHEKCPQAEGD